MLTNDDGVYSPGLAAVRQALSPHHDVWVLAPDGERSGMSNSITISEPIRCTRIEERVFASSGTPADCVILATLGVIPKPIDVVISGINIGPNLGSDVIYSGTAAAARQAAYKKIPGIALSLNSFKEPFYFEPVAEFTARHLTELITLWNEDHFININAPNVSGELEVRVTTPAMRRYDDHLLPFQPPRGGTYYFVDGHPEKTELEAGTDWHAVEHGFLSISPILLNPVNHAVENEYRQAGFARTP